VIDDRATAPHRCCRLADGIVIAAPPEKREASRFTPAVLMAKFLDGGEDEGEAGRERFRDLLVVRSTNCKDDVFDVLSVVLL